MEKHGQGQADSLAGIGCSDDCTRTSSATYALQQDMEASLFQRASVEDEADQEGDEARGSPDQPPSWSVKYYSRAACLHDALAKCCGLSVYTVGITESQGVCSSEINTTGTTTEILEWLDGSSLY